MPARAENELSRGVNGEVPRETPINEDLFSSKNQETGEEQIIFQSETPSQEILPSQPEIQVEEEVQLEQPLTHKRKPIRALLLKRIIEKWRKREITKEEKKKCLIALKQLWPVHAAICTVGFAAIGFRFGPDFLRTRSLTSLLWRMRSDPLFAAYILIPGVARLGTVLASEKRYGVKFSIGSKLISLWPFVGGGSAMPIETAYTLGEGPWLVNEIKERYKERYLTTPLTRVRGAFRGILSIFKRE